MYQLKSETEISCLGTHDAQLVEKKPFFQMFEIPKQYCS